ncbi:hypothetical protein TVAG_430070 [Trichomonas vaginalis G3]|uniref:Uncharacterized protein n=1 Tax=Trichomonas vaginalis (strain ATCC PRA-98 / G3) TaxID=412133 RepID=A2EI83_TRIV3|nr:V-type ATPase assembly factor PKR1 family [Trichomonas vaginalis G3]EAY07643.1 hypothetical protein TVAG_430070 [Trichomonas vaginalis G3]KAI5500509.1 V-type ATPase assembly factor PKR1 family [Trichomonas vaginalis G3]|eukprot:XP_001319866.1 hypothetical protein [Trichomonas vaginalis G3]
MSTEEKKAEVPYSEKSWIEKLLTPGVGTTMIVFLRICFILLLVFLTVSIFTTYSIHFVIMSVLALGLFCSFEYLIYNLKKYDLLNPEQSKEEKDKKQKKE